MILVLLGTFKINFSRPLFAIEKAAIEYHYDQAVIVQAGHTAFKSDVLNIRTFIDSDELNNLYQEAEIIVTHAGVGSILKAFKMKKKIIAIPRLYKYHEHVDDHQLDILEEFAKHNYLIPWNEHDNFNELVERAKNFTPVPYASNKQDLEQYLINYIEQIS